MTAPAIGSQRLRRDIGRHHRAMVVGMTAKVGGMAIRAGRGGIAIAKHGPVRIKPNAGHMQEIAGIFPQAGRGGMTGLAIVTMDG